MNGTFDQDVASHYSLATFACPSSQTIVGSQVMEKHPIVWGLDIGHSSIKAVKLSRNATGVTVLGYAIEPINVTEEGDRDESVVKALQLLAQHEEFGAIPVIASLSGRQIFSRTINIPVLNPKRVKMMVELEARQQIPGNFDEVEWGYHMSPAPDGASNDVALFAAKRELTDELVSKCKRAGINLVGVSVTSLALYNFVRFDQEFGDKETVIILDVGAENTDLVLYQGETLWMRTLALSGNDVTRVFMKKFRVSFEEAETLKRQIGDSRQAEKILKVLEGTLNELTGEVQRSLGFYKSQNPEANLENIVISGNTFRLPNLPEYIAERLRYTVNILEDLDKIGVASGLERENFLRDLQSLGVAIGLALQGTGLGKANVNLLSTTERMERVLKSKRWAAALVALLLGVTFTIYYMVVSGVMHENRAMSEVILSKYKDNEARVKDSKKVLEEVAPLAATLKGFNSFGSKGVVHAAYQGVLDTLQGFITSQGQINKGDKPPEEGGPPIMQALYVDSIEVLPFAYDKEAGPFSPLANDRLVRIKVRIPRLENDTLKGLPQQIVDKFKVIPVPDYLKSIYPNENLFAEAQIKSDVNSEDSYWLVDNTQVDNQTGTYKKITEEHKISVRTLTFECRFSSTSVAAVAADK
jgi:type IV pilus assembly protein PilM